MKWIALLPLAFCVLTACNNGAPVTTTTTIDTTETDTIDYALNEDSIKLTLNNTTPPEGFYAVTLPCTNCKGIEHTVLFNRDLSYRLEEKVLESNNAITQTSGAWKPVKGDIWLYKDSSVVARYTWKGDTLNFIDLKSGVRIPLRPLPGAMNVEAWKNKRAEGLEFFGTGTEPFWNIAIDEQKSIVFTRANVPKPLTFKPSKPIVKGDSTVYQVRKDTAALRVAIYNTFCSDGMSDNVYANKVTVVFNGDVYEGCGIVYK